jgi:toxin ParE1/3/4
MRTVRILEEASQEAIEAAAWYEYEQPGLGVEFFASVEIAIDVIEENFIFLNLLSPNKPAISVQND